MRIRFGLFPLALATFIGCGSAEDPSGASSAPVFGDPLLTGDAAPPGTIAISVGDWAVPEPVQVAPAPRVVLPACPISGGKFDDTFQFAADLQAALNEKMNAWASAMCKPPSTNATEVECWFETKGIPGAVSMQDLFQVIYEWRTPPNPKEPNNINDYVVPREGFSKPDQPNFATGYVDCEVDCWESYAVADLRAGTALTGDPKQAVPEGDAFCAKLQSEIPNCSMSDVRKHWKATLPNEVRVKITKPAERTRRTFMDYVNAANLFNGAKPITVVQEGYQWQLQGMTPEQVVAECAKVNSQNDRETACRLREPRKSVAMVKSKVCEKATIQSSAIDGGSLNLSQSTGGLDAGVDPTVDAGRVDGAPLPISGNGL